MLAEVHFMVLVVYFTRNGMAVGVMCRWFALFVLDKNFEMGVVVGAPFAIFGGG